MRNAVFTFQTRGILNMSNRSIALGKFRLQIPHLVVIIDIALLIAGFIFTAFNGTVSGVCFCLAILTAYYGCIVYFLSLCGTKKYIIGNEKSILFLLIVGILFVFAVISRDRFVYFWDYRSYWSLCLQECNSFFTQPLETMHRLYSDINAVEYNSLIPALEALPMRIIGTSFLSYTILTFLMFGFPMSFVLSVAINKLQEKCGFKSAPLWVTMLIILCVPSTLTPLLDGYCDISVLFLIAVLWMLTFSFDWYSFNIKFCTAISIVLLLILFERRYFAFFVVGYVVGLCVYGVIQFIQERKSIKYFFANLFCIGAFCSAVLLSFFRDFLVRGIFNNYAVAYSAYSTGDNFDKAVSVLSYFGLILMILAIIGCVALLVSKKGRAYLAFLVISPAISAFLFFRIQSMGIHQQYVVLSQGLILLVIGIYKMIYSMRKDVLKKTAAVTAAAFLTVNFTYGFSLFPDFNSKVHSSILSQLDYKPKVRDDIIQLQMLKQELRSMADENKSKVYVVSSSILFNDDIIRALSLPDDLNGAQFLNLCSNVDLIDGFRTGFFNSNIIVVADPAQYHLRPSDQQVVGILANEFLNNGKIGQHFSYIKEYQIDGGVKVKIYKKKAPYTKDDLTYLSRKFDAVYPQYPDLFKNRILSYPLDQQK